MAVSGHRKGGVYERKICDLLSTWRGTHKAFIRERFGDSDIRCPEDFPFSIECKHHRVINPYDIFTAPTTSVLLNALKQTKANAEGDGKRPMLVFRQNNSIDMMVLWRNSGFRLKKLLDKKIIEDFYGYIKFSPATEIFTYYCFDLSIIIGNITYKRFVGLYD